MSENFLIGTYTKKNSTGIYSVTLDPQQGKLTHVTPVANTQNPTYLGVSAANRCYAVYKNGDQGGVGAFDLATTPATLLGAVTGAGAPPAYIGVDETHQLVFSGNYHLGTVDVFKINPDGTLTQTERVTHQGLTGPQPEQASPHVHYCDLTPDQRLVVCDLGMDLTVIYDVSETGKLIAKSRYQSTPGFGPRHIQFHPDGDFAYLIGELGSGIEVLHYDAATATLTQIQSIATIPDDWTSHNGAAAIHLSPDGRFVYASNRGEDTLAVFQVQPNHTLVHIQSISTEGSFPRDFELSQDGTYIVCANQETDNLTLFQRNLETGRLTLQQKDVACPEGVCVKRWKA